MGERQAGKTDAPKLTRAQFAVLRSLAGGWTMIPVGRDDMEGRLVRGKGESRLVLAKTINRLFFEEFITLGDVYDPWKLTPKGKAAVQAWQKRKGAKTDGD
jgi:hypothetical protein